ncbi:MAG TPA: hypothetical protein VIL98_10075 [Gaiellaceae bacterium]
MFEKRRRNALRVTRSTLWSGGIFLCSFAAYFAVGYRVVVRQHVVPFDAVARLAHAYFVWWNAPPKLAAIGFVWPPLSTLVFLPAAGIRPLATSLVALPLTTSFFAGLLLALIDRVLALAQMSWKLRLPLVVAFGANPMIAFYAVNGMSEIVYLTFLVAGVYSFLRWFLVREARFLVLTAVAFAFGVLSRYEVISWAVVLVGALVVAMMRQHVTRSEVEGSVIAYLAPVVYALGLWLFVNWLILGHPLYFLSQQAPGFAQTTPANAPPPPAQVSTHIPAATTARDLVTLNWHLFPITIVIVVALVATFLARRDLMAVTLAGFIALNAFFTGVLIWTSGNPGLLQLRYNMRAMPLALVGVAWLFLTLRSRRSRAVVWLASLALLVGSAASTWRTMETYGYQFLEQAFTRAVATGDDQEGTRSIGGYVVGIQPERQMAAWIRTHVHRRDAILTDDAQSFAVMLLTGHPDWFVDRIDRGDTDWLATLDAPYGKVQYLLVSSIATNDLTRFRYPQLFTTGEPAFTRAYATSHFAIFRVARTPPRTREHGPG